MADLQYRQQKLQETRAFTPFEEYVKEIYSRYPFTFYKEKGATSCYPETKRVPTLTSLQQFQQDRDWYLQYGIDYDENTSFFKQFSKLYRTIPQPRILHYRENHNADFANYSLWSKNIYLSFTVINNCENVVYSFSIKNNSTNILNSMMVRDNSENIYMSVGITQSFSILYSKFIHNSSYIRFSTNLIWCNNCMFCNDLENQSYCIRNQQYTKEQYTIEKNKILQQKEHFQKRFDALDQYGSNQTSTNCQGNYILQSNDVTNWYCVYQIEHGRNCLLVWWEELWEHTFDCAITTPPHDHLYGVLWSWTNLFHTYNSFNVSTGENIYYSTALQDCSYCFWCIWLRNKQYCILNQQYTKEEWYATINSIFLSMEKEGTFGKFFPSSLNPYYFNDTIASLIEDFTREEAETAWYLRRDEEIAVDIPDRMEVVELADLDQYEEMKDGVRTIDPAILKKVIRDEAGNVYRVIKMEYDFLMKYGLPLPRRHWLERLKGHFRVK